MVDTELGLKFNLASGRCSNGVGNKSEFICSFLIFSSFTSLLLLLSLAPLNIFISISRYMATQLPYSPSTCKINWLCYIVQNSNETKSDWFRNQMGSVWVKFPQESESIPSQSQEQRYEIRQVICSCQSSF